MLASSLRAGLQGLTQLNEALKDEDINARLTTLDITLQGLEMTQQRQAQDPRLRLVAAIQQQRLQQDLRRLAFDVLGYQALIKLNVGENEPLPAMLAALPQQLVRLAQDYINQPLFDALVAPNNRKEPTYTRLVRLLLNDESASKVPRQDLP